MSTPSSASLGQSSSKSGNQSTSSSSRRSILNTVVDRLDSINLRKKKKKQPLADFSVIDARHHNTTYNYGIINNAYGNNIVQNVTVGIDKEILVFNMDRSKHAEFNITNSITRREPCAPDTRQYVLKQLKAWCREKADLLFYWLSGMPGTGKTTIAYTLCQYLKGKHLLGASFFCSKLVDDCKDVNLIFPTIAFQLAKNYPIFRKQLAEVLHKDPDLPRRQLDDQLKQLIIEPFLQLETEEESMPTNLVVVLDALDECTENQPLFLQTLIKFASQLPFRLVLTSRPEYVIHDALPTKDPVPSIQRFFLHEIEKDVVREDIVKYLQHAFASAIPPVSATAIDTLATQSGSSFLIAAMTARLVMQPDGIEDPERRLENVLESLATRSMNDITASLDRVYTGILSQITKTYKAFPNEVEDIKDILFTIICAYEPLTRGTIAALWGISVSNVERRLRPLRSVICVLEDPNKPITLFHATFPDFLTDKTRAGSFYCDMIAFHGKLARTCFRTMNGHLLHPNICHLTGRLSNEEVEQEVIESHINPGLAYATVHWGRHLELSNLPGGVEAYEEIQTFCSRNLFHWLECISLLRCLYICERALGVLKAHLMDRTMLDLSQEVLKFAQLNYDIIHHSATEIYFSALIWVPTASLIRTHYASLWEQKQLPRALRGLPTGWEEATRAIKTHKGQVNSITISATDGDRIISGSDDQTVRVWNAAAHREEQVFTGHRGQITSVAVSPKDARIFSASYDGTVRVWDLAKPEATLTFERHSEGVLCVAISSDGSLVCSCDRGNNVLVWNAETALVAFSMKTTGSWKGDTRSVDFTPDNSHICYASQDAVHTYNLQQRSTKHILKGHNGAVQTVAVSPDGGYIITGALDNTAKVWQFSSGKKTRTLQGHTGPVQSVASCYDSQRAITGSDDKTIRVWNMHTGDILAVLTGHTQVIWSVSVFPDDLRAASGSADRTMMIWDIPQYVQQGKKTWKLWAGKSRSTIQLAMKADNPWSGSFLASSPTQLCLVLEENAHIIDSSTLKEKTIIHVGHTTSAAFSFRETRLATVHQHTLSVWDIATGRRIFRIKAPRQNFLCVVFSHNDQRILTGSDDRLIQIWDATNGVEQLALQQPGDDVRNVSFSSDDAQIYATSSNKLACIWNIATGRLERMIKTKFERAPTVFTADGNYLIEYTPYKSVIWNIKTGHPVHPHDLLTGYNHWTPLSNGVLYTILDSSWICKAADITKIPTKLCWIPPKYRNLGQERSEGGEPIACASVSGDRVFLSSTRGAVVLDMRTSP